MEFSVDFEFKFESRKNTLYNIPMWILMKLDDKMVTNMKYMNLNEIR